MDAPNRPDVHTEDPVVYPVTDNVGEGGLQSFVIRGLLVLLEDYFRAHGRPVLVGGDQFFYYKQFDNRSVVAPDVYVIDDETTPQWKIPSWKVWERGGKVPTFALEIVSSDYRKDYRGEILDVSAPGAGGRVERAGVEGRGDRAVVGVGDQPDL